MFFASPTQLKCLESSSVWHIDGTFKTSPQLFQQTFIIYSWLMDEMVPCAFNFLKNKTQEIYTRVLTLLKNLSN